MVTALLPSHSPAATTHIRSQLGGQDVYYWLTRLPVATAPVKVDGRIRRRGRGGWTVTL